MAGLTGALGWGPGLGLAGLGLVGLEVLMGAVGADAGATTGTGGGLSGCRIGVVPPVSGSEEGVPEAGPWCSPPVAPADTPEIVA